MHKKTVVNYLTVNVVILDRYLSRISNRDICQGYQTRISVKDICQGYLSRISDKDICQGYQTRIFKRNYLAVVIIEYFRRE